MNHKVIGDKTEAIILSKLIDEGYTVSIPFGENQRYDFVVEKNGILKRVQCKTGRVRDGYIEFNTSSSTHNKRTNYVGQIEGFMVYSHELKKTYYIPIEESTKTEMRLRINKPKKFGNTHTINWASEYEFARIAK